MHTALATACRTCPALGWSQPCSTVTNRASAQTALMLDWYVAGSIVSLPAGWIPRLPQEIRALRLLVQSRPARW